MGIKICPDCQGKVSDQLSACPHCGHNFAVTEIIEDIKMVGVICPSCGSNQTKPEGQRHYRCESCGTLFIASKTKTIVNSGTPIDLTEYTNCYRIKPVLNEKEVLFYLLKHFRDHQDKMPDDIYDVEFTDVKLVDRAFTFISVESKFETEKKVNAPFTNVMSRTVTPVADILITQNNKVNHDPYKFAQLDLNNCELEEGPKPDITTLKQIAKEVLLKKVNGNRFVTYSFKGGYVYLTKLIRYILPYYEITVKFRGKEYIYFVSSEKEPSIFTDGDSISIVTNPNHPDYKMCKLERKMEVGKRCSAPLFASGVGFIFLSFPFLHLATPGFEAVGYSLFGSFLFVGLLLVSLSIYFITSRKKAEDEYYVLICEKKRRKEKGYWEAKNRLEV